MVPPDERDDPVVTVLDAISSAGAEPEETDSGTPVGLLASLSRVGVAVIETDAAGRVRHLNQAAERLTGWPVSQARGGPVEDVFQLAQAPHPGPEIELGPEHTALLSRRDGQQIPVRHVVGAASARDSGRLYVFRDVNAQQLLALRLARLSRYDAVTGLLNRHTITERIELALAESRRRGARHALCFFDLDRFRLINSTCGHEAGDDLLQWVATRVHEFVGPSDSAGRIGGDEFALLLAGREGKEAERVARDLQRRLLEFRFGWGDKRFTVPLAEVLGGI